MPKKWRIGVNRGKLIDSVSDELRREGLESSYSAIRKATHEYLSNLESKRYETSTFRVVNYTKELKEEIKYQVRLKLEPKKKK